ncbi:GAF domain-containing protein [Pseudanabaena biceps]|nr:GAF domain-containing protein [Pseudanabaena biceps]
MDSSLLNQVRHLCRDRASYEHLKAILVQQERVHQLSWEERYDKIMSTQATDEQTNDVFSNIIVREKALAQLADAIQRSPSLDLVLQIAVQVAQKILQVDRVAIFCRHPDGRGEFTTDAIATGLTSLAEMPERQLSLSRHMLESTQAEQPNQTIDSISSSNLSSHIVTLLEEIGISSYAANKIYAGQDIWGTLVAFHGSAYHVWSESDRTSLTLIATQVSTAIALTNLRQQSQELSVDLHILQAELNQLQEKVLEISNQISVAPAPSTENENKISEEIEPVIVLDALAEEPIITPAITTELVEDFEPLAAISELASQEADKKCLENDKQEELPDIKSEIVSGIPFNSMSIIDNVVKEFTNEFTNEQINESSLPALDLINDQGQAEVIEPIEIKELEQDSISLVIANNYISDILPTQEIEIKTTDLGDVEIENSPIVNIAEVDQTIVSEESIPDDVTEPQNLTLDDLQDLGFDIDLNPEKFAQIEPAEIPIVQITELEPLQLDPPIAQVSHELIDVDELEVVTNHPESKSEPQEDLDLEVSTLDMSITTDKATQPEELDDKSQIALEPSQSLTTDLQEVEAIALIESSQDSDITTNDVRNISEEESIEDDDIEPAIEREFLETILAIAGNDSQGFAYLVNVIDTYLEESPKLVQIIDKALAVNDHPRLLQSLNTLRLNSDYVGALFLSYQCRQLESAVKAKYVVLIYACLSQVAIELQRVTDALRIEREKYS